VSSSIPVSRLLPEANGAVRQTDLGAPGPAARP